MVPHGSRRGLYSVAPVGGWGELKLKYSRLENPPDFARDVTNVGHWGGGELELAITSQAQLEVAEPIIRSVLEHR